jgi:3-methylfumaryl-CoA hydratase
MSKSEGPMHGTAATPQDAQAWVGRVETREGALSPEFAGMLMGALGQPAAPQPAIHTGAHAGSVALGGVPRIRADCRYRH